MVLAERIQSGCTPMEAPTAMIGFGKTNPIQVRPNDADRTAPPAATADGRQLTRFNSHYRWRARGNVCGRRY
jgi:hypothetical protein